MDGQVFQVGKVVVQKIIQKCTLSYVPMLIMVSDFVKHGMVVNTKTS